MNDSPSNYFPDGTGYRLHDLINSPEVLFGFISPRVRSEQGKEITDKPKEKNSKFPNATYDALPPLGVFMHRYSRGSGSLDI
jgi:hypothetical protein